MWWRILGAVCLLGSVLTGSRVHAQTSGAPSFVPGACHFKPGADFTAGKNLRCGDLIVPENRSQPGSPLVHLAVAVFRTPSAHRQPDPVVFLQGGPGGPIISDLGHFVTRTSARTLMGNHDLILIDQRGTGYSRPNLGCPAVAAAVARALLRNASEPRQVAVETKALQTCHDRLVARGVDLNQFTTMNDAADIADLRIALDLPAMNLYGVSYGTRVALAVMKYFPTGIRSVVLDSIVPPQYNVFTDAVAAESRAFNAVFAACRKLTHCNQSYPHLKRSFGQVLKRLNTHPIRFKTTIAGSTKRYTVKLHGAEFADFVRSLMYVTPLIKYVPAIIEATAHGKVPTSGQLFNPTLAQNAGVALGMYESVECAEDAPTAVTASLNAAAATLPIAIRLPTLIRQVGELNECRNWNVQAVGPDIRQPVTSAIPTLLLGGQFDPITPPSNIDAIAPTLSQSYSFVFPGTGHGVRYTSPCPDGIIDAFYDNPGRRPDGACVSRMKAAFK